jgi:hypothetical protein
MVALKAKKHNHNLPALLEQQLPEMHTHLDKLIQ